jgi:glutamate-5-semialdehyde dehydrogenase
MQSSSNPILDTVKRARQASVTLALTSGKTRRQGVKILAEAVATNFDAILEANTLDLEISREMAVPEPIIDWLKLTPERLEIAVGFLKQLVRSASPTKRLINTPYTLESTQTYYQLMPLGTIALIYEAFPELAIMAVGMSLKTGNSIILRGCTSASNSNQTIFAILQNALATTDLPLSSIEAIFSDGNSTIQDLIEQSQDLNLIIPYGRPSLVQQVAEQATVPVLRTAIGNCYTYWSASGDLEPLKYAIIDSHDSEPDAVNAIEKVLIYNGKKPASLQSLFNYLAQENFQLRGDEQLVKEFPEYLKPVHPGEWKQPYLNKTVAFKYVDSLAEAIIWINQNSNGHADSIFTESYSESRQFVREVNSAVIYVNTSPRFYRYLKSGETLGLGMCNRQNYRQGSIGIEAFTTIQQIVQG